MKTLFVMILLALGVSAVAGTTTYVAARPKALKQHDKERFTGFFSSFGRMISSGWHKLADTEKPEVANQAV